MQYTKPRIAVAEANELASLVVLNKADLDPTVESLLDPYRQAGYATLFTSVVQDFPKSVVLKIYGVKSSDLWRSTAT